MNKWIGFINTTDGTSGILCPQCKTKIKNIIGNHERPAADNTLTLTGLIYCPVCGVKNITESRRNDL